MYWHFQEKVVFYIVIFVVFIFQIISLLTIRDLGYSLSYGIILIGLNLLFFFGMIKYAQWIWKQLSISVALKRVLKYEAIFIFGLLVMVLITKALHPELR